MASAPADPESEPGAHLLPKDAPRKSEASRLFQSLLALDLTTVGLNLNRKSLLLGTVAALTGTFLAGSLALFFLVGIAHSRHVVRPSPCGSIALVSVAEDQVVNASLDGGLNASIRVLQDAPLQAPQRELNTASLAVRYNLAQQPEMYGKVPEKTIWSYWYNEETCPSSKKCTLPPVVQLCVETVRKNKGGFKYKIMHRDDVEKYVTRMELPIHFASLRPAQQKDALMNALLARYGGVALDITVLLLRPFDEYWDEMVAKAATFRGYMYRYNGMEWGNSEVSVVWFLMSRRQGIFSSAVRAQTIGMGDHKAAPGVPAGYHNPYFALGDQTLLPILSQFNYSLPRCGDDPTVGPPVSWPTMCPELEFQPYNDSLPGPARNDATIMLREPRDGPQLPFAFLDGFSMGLWHVDGKSQVNSGIPPRCDTHKECWDVFMERFNRKPPAGETRVMDFIKMFGSAGKMKDKSREELLSDHQTYFFHWLSMAGLRF